VRKVINFVPTLRTLDGSGFVYSRVKEEEDKIMGYLSESPRPLINLVCDLRCTPPTYGDLTAFLMAYRILKTKFDVRFIIRIDELRTDWDLLTQEMKVQRLDHFKKLASGVVVAGGSELKVLKSLDELLVFVSEGKTIFSEYVNKRKKIYWDLKHLNDLLYIQLGCASNVLLDQVEFSKLDVEPVEPYALWHIRQNSAWNKLSDTSEKEIIEYYIKVRAILGEDLKVIVCGTDLGVAVLKQLKAKHNMNFEISRIYSKDFLGDIALLQRAKFFLQIGGGGLSEFAWSSSTPLLDFNYPLTKADWISKRILGVSKTKLVSWATGHQILTLAFESTFSNLENELQRFVNGLKALEK
jgi:hypothetical protein